MAELRLSHLQACYPSCVSPPTDSTVREGPTPSQLRLNEYRSQWEGAHICSRSRASLLSRALTPVCLSKEEDSARGLPPPLSCGAASRYKQRMDPVLDSLLLHGIRQPLRNRSQLPAVPFGWLVGCRALSSSLEAAQDLCRVGREQGQVPLARQHAGLEQEILA